MSIRTERKQLTHQALIDASLRLCQQGRSFSTLSLREVTREVGMVPTAFYRHFADMDELGLALAKQVIQRLKAIIAELSHNYLTQTNTKTLSSVQFFFYTVDQMPRDWQFILSERWGGSHLLRHYIQHEIKQLTEDLATDLTANQDFEHIQNNADLEVISSILVNMSFTWAMNWLALSNEIDQERRQIQHKQYMEQVITQVRLIFRGIDNWQSTHEKAPN